MHYRNLKKYPGIPIIILFYVISALLILPHLNFPFNDDWGYALLTKGFVETGSFTFFNWCDPTMIFLVCWGAIWSWLFGFSMTSLHISTVVLSIGAAIAFYLTLKRFGLDESVSIAGTLILLFNPIFFFNSFTFMTDVPFVGITLLTLYFYLRYYQTGKSFYLILFSIFSVFAFLIRQVGLSITLAVFIFELFRLEKQRHRMFTFLFILVLPLIVDFSAFVWRMTQPNIFKRVYSIPRAIWSIELIFFIFEYIALFTLPLTVAWIVKIENWKNLFSSIKKIFPIGFFVLILGVLIFLGRTLPFLRNQVTPFGMFGVNEVLMGNRQEIFSKAFWVVVTVLSSFGLSLLLTFFLVVGKSYVTKLKGVKHVNWRAKLKHARLIVASHPEVVYYLTSFILLMVPILLLGNVFDRYVIAVMPAAVLFFLLTTRKYRLPQFALYITLALMFFWTITISYDTIGWNKVKWAEAKELVNSGIAPTDIDAGFDWCGWYCRKPLQSGPPPKEVDYFKSWYLKHRFWDCDNQYAIAFSPPTGFDTMKKIKYPRPFWLKIGYLYVLKRSDIK